MASCLFPAFLRRSSVACILLPTACGPGPGTEQAKPALAVERPRISVNNNGEVLLDELEDGLCCQLVQLRMYCGQYLVGYDEEGYATAFYKPYPDSAWANIPYAGGTGISLDTANIDKAGKPELLLTKTHKAQGSGGGTEVQTLVILSMEGEPRPLLTTVVSCHEYSSPGMHPGPYRSYSRRQDITAGFGFLRVGPVVLTCENADPLEGCQCNGFAEDKSAAREGAELSVVLAEGIYTIRSGQLMRSGSL